ncbi:hypothetical protein PTKIN_Ptkin04bG0049900 [Pterospermum kingtungense]
MEHSSLEAGELVSNTNESLEASHIGLDHGSNHENVLIKDSKVGSPCSSAHHVSEYGIGTGGGEDSNFKEVEDDV